MNFNYDEFNYLKTRQLRDYTEIVRGNSLLYNWLASHYGEPLNSVFKQTLTEFDRLNHGKVNQYVGVEIELEQYNPLRDARLNNDLVLLSMWNNKADGSLRNNGQEFITNFGTTTNTVGVSLEALYRHIRAKSPDAVANARTGLHVHMDLSGESIYNIANILLLYAVLEPMFFHASGDRDNNIFCVPWYDNHQTIGGVLKLLIEDAKQGSMARGEEFRWRNYSKYCGLNLSTLGQVGTLEFRMHKGTYDPEEIMRWIMTLEKLFMLGRNTDLIHNLMRFRECRTYDKYYGHAEIIFQLYPNLLANFHHIYNECKSATFKNYRAFMGDNSHELKCEVVLLGNKKEKVRLERDGGGIGGFAIPGGVVNNVHIRGNQVFQPIPAAPPGGAFFQALIDDWPIERDEFPEPGEMDEPDEMPEQQGPDEF